MIKSNYLFFHIVFLLPTIFVFALASQLKTKLAFDFELSIATKNESCSLKNGQMIFTVSQVDPNATITYTVFLLPNIDTPLIVQSANTLNGLAEGDYRVTVSVELDGVVSTKVRDVTIGHSTEATEFNIITEEVCGENDGEIIVEMISGTATSYEIQGPVDRGPQSSNQFDNLPEGSYKIIVTNECGEIFSKSYEVLKTDLYIDESKQEFDPLLPACDEITVRHYINSVNSTIQYPLTLEFNINLPSGGIEVATAIIEEGDQFEGFIEATIPFFHDNLYTYGLRIIDNCGNIAESDNDFQVERKLSIAADRLWGAGLCGKRQLTIAPINYVPPYDVIFMEYPDGFDPGNTEGFQDERIFFDNGSYIPDGPYEFKIVDGCGNESETVEFIHTTRVGPPTASEFLYKGCGPDNGSVQLMNYDYELLKVEIISAPAVYSATLPHEVSENIRESDKRRFYMNNLPVGTYEFRVETSCSEYPVHSVEVEIKGQEILENKVDVIEACGSFSVTLQHESSLSGDQRETFGLQKRNPETGNWGHPELDAEYHEGDDLNDTNSILLLNNSTRHNLSYSGDFRVVKTFRNWKNGSEIETGEDAFTFCLNVLEEFSSDTFIGFADISSFTCNDDLFDVAISATGYSPITFRITSKDGLPFQVDNGTDPLFKSLEEGRYTFQVQDECGNTIHKVFDITKSDPPRIVPHNLCEGEYGELAVSDLDFLAFKWWKEGDPSNILSKSSSLSFESFNANSDAGIYKVELSHTDPNSCLNEILEFEIPADDDGPQAGESGEFDVCEGDIIDLFDFFPEGSYDTYGKWEEISGSNSLIGSSWTTTDLAPGIYQFVYTVTALCEKEGQERTIITANLNKSPTGPSGKENQGFCETDVPTVSDLVAEGENINWYLVPSGGRALHPDETLLDNTTYYAEQIIDGCPSVTRLQTLVTIEKTIQNNNIEQDQEINGTESPALLTGSTPTGGTGTYLYEWQKSPDQITWVQIPNANEKDYQPSAIEETTFYRRIVKGLCEDYISNTVKITLKTVDMVIQKTSFNKDLYDAEEFSYEIIVENRGEYDATNVVISDLLPSNLIYVSSETYPSSSIIQSFPANSNQTVTWEIPFFPTGGSITIEMVVLANQEGNIVNTAVVSSTEKDENPEDNSASDQNKVSPLFIPNVIKPDNDGRNESFIIRSIDKFDRINLTIFNRWGDHVYESNDYKNDWSAEGLGAGTYYYIITGTIRPNQEKVYKGWVQVIK